MHMGSLPKGARARGMRCTECGAMNIVFGNTKPPFDCVYCAEKLPDKIEFDRFFKDRDVDYDAMCLLFKDTGQRDN